MHFPKYPNERSLFYKICEIQLFDRYYTDV